MDADSKTSLLKPLSFASRPMIGIVIVTVPRPWHREKL